MKNGLKVFGIALLALMLLGAVVLIVKYGVKDAKKGAAITSPDLKVNNLKWGKADKGERCVGGSLLNVSGRAYKNAAVKMALYDAAGKVLIQITALNETGIKPGETWSFCEIIGDDVARFTIVEVSGSIL